MQAVFGVRLNAVSWTAEVGFYAEDEGYLAAIEMSIESLISQVRDMQQTLEKAWVLSNTLMAMREDGRTLDEIDKMLKAIAADGGL